MVILFVVCNIFPHVPVVAGTERLCHGNGKPRADAGGKSPHRKQQHVAGADAQDRQDGAGPADKASQE